MMANDVKALQACVQNTLDPRAAEKKHLAGIIGDVPSHYAKSPQLWNKVFEALQMDAVYLPFDVEETRVSQLLRALRGCDRLMGANVTVPYKVKIMEFLDEIEEQAKRIKAVNTVVRTKEGRLVGYNTDGKGFVDSITTPQPGAKGPFIETLKGIEALIIGAGGSARAVAFHLAQEVVSGRLIICNRTTETANALAEEINRTFGNVSAIDETELRTRAPKVKLIVNCTTKGQGGIRRLSDGKVTVLEPYSALAPANPAVFPESEYRKPGFYRAWLTASLSDIEANNRASFSLALSVPLHVGFSDLVYFPAETVFLRHARLSGHRTLNGKGMIVAQGVEAFFHRVCREYLMRLGLYHAETAQRIFKLMYEAWGTEKAES